MFEFPFWQMKTICFARQPHWRLLLAEGKRAEGDGAEEDLEKGRGFLCWTQALIYFLAAGRALVLVGCVDLWRGPAALGLRM